MKCLFELLKSSELTSCGVKCLLVTEETELHDIVVQELSSHTEVRFSISVIQLLDSLVWPQC